MPRRDAEHLGGVKACKKKHGAKRARCEKAARRAYGAKAAEAKKRGKR